MIFCGATAGEVGAAGAVWGAPGAVCGAAAAGAGAAGAAGVVWAVAATGTPESIVPASNTVMARDPNFERIQDLRAQISQAIGHHQIDQAGRIYLELHAIDPRQVLSRQNQLDIANQLFSTGVHGAAAAAHVPG